MQVFLSYADSDLTLARKIVDGLQAAGFQVWYDYLYVFPGDNWGALIGEGLEQSDAMIVLLTPDGLRSQAVQRNTSFALSNTRYAGRLLPVIVSLPDTVTNEQIPWIYRRLNPIVVRDEEIETGIKQIVRVLSNPVDPRFQEKVSAA